MALHSAVSKVRHESRSRSERIGTKMTQCDLVVSANLNARVYQFRRSDSEAAEYERTGTEVLILCRTLEKTIEPVNLSADQARDLAERLVEAADTVDHAFEARIRLLEGKKKERKKKP